MSIGTQDKVFYYVWIITTFIGFIPQLIGYIRDNTAAKHVLSIKHHALSGEAIEKFSVGTWDLNNPDVTLNSMVSAQPYIYCKEHVGHIEENVKIIATAVKDADTTITDIERRLEPISGQLNEL